MRKCQRTWVVSLQSCKCWRQPAVAVHLSESWQTAGLSGSRSSAQSTPTGQRSRSRTRQWNSLCWWHCRSPRETMAKKKIIVFINIMLKNSISQSHTHNLLLDSGWHTNGYNKSLWTANVFFFFLPRISILSYWYCMFTLQSTHLTFKKSLLCENATVMSWLDSQTTKYSVNSCFSWPQLCMTFV